MTIALVTKMNNSYYNVYSDYNNPKHTNLYHNNTIFFLFMPSIIRTSPITIRVFTQMNNYPRDNKNDNIILPALIAIIAVLSIYFYLQLTYSTSLTIFPSLNNTKTKQFEQTKK
eukprot:bmy_10977T0